MSVCVRGESISDWGHYYADSSRRRYDEQVSLIRENDGGERDLHPRWTSRNQQVAALSKCPFSETCGAILYSHVCLLCCIEEEGFPSRELNRQETVDNIQH